MNGPPVGPVTVPAELEPSPQSIVAVKSAVVACEFASARLATLPLKDVEETGEMAQVDARAASPKLAGATMSGFVRGEPEWISLSKIERNTDCELAHSETIPLIMNSAPENPLYPPWLLLSLLMEIET